MTAGDAPAPQGSNPLEKPPLDRAQPSSSRVERVAGGLSRDEWSKIAKVIVAGLALAAALLFAMPALQVKSNDYRCPLPLPTPTASADLLSLSTSCRAPDANSDTTNQQTLDTARSAARTPYGVLAAALLAGAAAIVGVIVNGHNARLTRDTINATLDANDATRDRDEVTRQRDETTARLTQAGQYTDRYIKAIGLINDDKLNARVGGLYALEQLAKEAPLTYHVTIVDVLSAYIRERAPMPPPTHTADQAALQVRRARPVDVEPPGPLSAALGDYTHTADQAALQVRRARPVDIEPPQPLSFSPNQTPTQMALDIQAALTILGRRITTHTTRDGRVRYLEDRRLDLRETHLESADLRNANLQGAYLPNANLEGAYLFGANLQSAYLRNTNLEGAYLFGAHLEGADLFLANMKGADLPRAKLEGAGLIGAKLERADLRKARLKGAILNRANLREADLPGAHLAGALMRDAHLERADLRNAHLKGADLRNAHLEGADLRNARLEGANLLGANLEGANLNESDLSHEQLAEVLVDDATLLPVHLQR